VRLVLLRRSAVGKQRVSRRGAEEAEDVKGSTRGEAAFKSMPRTRRGGMMKAACGANTLSAPSASSVPPREPPSLQIQHSRARGAGVWRGNRRRRRVRPAGGPRHTGLPVHGVGIANGRGGIVLTLPARPISYEAAAVRARVLAVCRRGIPRCSPATGRVPRAAVSQDLRKRRRRFSFHRTAGRAAEGRKRSANRFRLPAASSSRSLRSLGTTAGHIT
jgi:hypothetical protein